MGKTKKYIIANISVNRTLHTINNLTVKELICTFNIIIMEYAKQEIHSIMHLNIVCNIDEGNKIIKFINDIIKDKNKIKKIKK